MGKYAKTTTVSSDRSRAELEQILRRYGADQFMYGTDSSKVVIGFRMQRIAVRFILPLPDRNDPEFTTYQRGYSVRKRAQDAADKLYEQAIRQKWRALVLVVKAKLEAVESEISTFEEEFLAHIMLPDGQTVGGHMLPQIRTAYETGKMPPLLPHFGRSTA